MTEPWQGTVTFVLTDVEGSVRLWRDHPAGMALATARLDALVAEVVAGSRGSLIKARGEGDSHFAVFGRAIDAVLAGRDLQTAFASESWPEGCALRVRAAIHTGDVYERAGDYYGPVVNYCARLRAAGHGGQTLVSAVTHGLVVDTLPAGVTLRCLGQHRLRDLSHPAEVFQLVCPSAPSDFPPLRSVDAARNNLPIQLTTYVARESDLAEARRLLDRSRIVTMVGPGGAGKTRMALHLAAEVLEDYPGGCWLADIGALRDPALVGSSLCAALSVRQTAQASLGDSVAERVGDRRALVIMDNCEHLIDACAEVCVEVLSRCPSLSILATSREELGVPGEIVFQVGPLDLPVSTSGSASTAVRDSAAVRLFEERARQVQPAFVVSDRNASAVVGICRQLDGLPLAIELAAARLSVLSVHDLAARLSHRFAAVARGPRTAPERHQTLLATIDWSYRLLAPSEQAVFVSLAVFAGAFTMDAAGAVCDLPDNGDILEPVSGLVHKSMLSVVVDSRATRRYRMLGTMREYALRNVGDRADEATARHRHAAYYESLVNRLRVDIDGDDATAALDMLAEARDDLNAALRWCLKERAIERGLQLASGLWQVWRARGLIAEGRQHLTQFLALSPPGVPSKIRVSALQALGNLAYYDGDLVTAENIYAETVTLARRRRDRVGVAQAKTGLGLVATARGEYSLAASLHRQALRTWRALGDRRRIVESLTNLALAHWSTGDYVSARRSVIEALDRHAAGGDSLLGGPCLTLLGYIDLEEGDYQRARANLERGLRLHEAAGNRQQSAEALNVLSYLERLQGRRAEAAATLETVVRIADELADRWLSADAHLELAECALDAGELDIARDRFAICLSLSRDLGRKRASAWALLGLARVDALDADRPSAEANLAEACRLFDEIGYNVGSIACLALSADLARIRGDNAAARAQLWDALALLESVPGAAYVLAVLDVAARLLHEIGDPRASLRLAAASTAARRRFELPMPPVLLPAFDAAWRAATAALGEAEVNEATDAGARLSLQEAMNEARRLLGGGAAHRDPDRLGAPDGPPATDPAPDRIRRHRGSR